MWTRLLWLLPQHLLTRVLNDPRHLLHHKVQHDRVLGARTTNGRHGPGMINILVRLRDGEASLQLQEQPTQKARLLAAPNEPRVVNVRVLLVELDQLDLCVRRGRALTQVLELSSQLLVTQVRDCAEPAHA